MVSDYSVLDESGEVEMSKIVVPVQISGETGCKMATIARFPRLSPSRVIRVKLAKQVEYEMVEEVREQSRDLSTERDSASLVQSELHNRC